MKLTISKYIYDKCVQFAHDRIDGSASLYKYRGESNKNKQIEDIVIGTCGEWGAYRFLKEHGYEVAKPDMKIYENSRKSFSADLTDGDALFHVKSQSVISRERYGSSWLFQRSDALVRAPEPEEYLVLTSVDGREVEILAVIDANLICKHDLWGECKVPRYRHSKVALYLDQIPSKYWRKF
jgi:hypothetical protein